jgi:TPR repeat protein
MKTKIGKLVVSAVATFAFATLSNSALASPEAWSQAESAYESSHYAQALEIYQALAAKGDARAAERAGHMLVQGESLYGDAVPRDTARGAQLLKQAANAGSPTAAYLLSRAESRSIVRASLQ